MVNDFNILKGKTLAKIENINKEELIFTTISGEIYKMFHCEDDSECVTIDDICGDLDDLIGSPILIASEDTNIDKKPDDIIVPDYHNDSFTWTFYNIATKKGHVTIRWYGTSNGYYSEAISFIRLK